MTKLIFCSPNKLEEYRFFRFFKSDKDQYLYYSQIETVFSIFFRNTDDLTFIINGLRFPDRFIMYLCKLKSINLIILQHSVAIPDYTNYEKLKKILINFWKFFTWFIFCAFLGLVFCTISKRTNNRLGSCFYFTDEYAIQVRKAHPSLSFRKCSWPNMILYGSSRDTIVSGHVKNFFIDEPFESTLGIASDVILNKAITYISPKDKLVVKLHPRSAINKFDSFLDRVEITSFFPESADNIFSYKSNLGYFFKAKKIKYIYSLEINDFIPKLENEDLSSIEYTYISECMELFE